MTLMAVITALCRAGYSGNGFSCSGLCANLLYNNTHFSSSLFTLIGISCIFLQILMSVQSNQTNVMRLMLTVAMLLVAMSVNVIVGFIGDGRHCGNLYYHIYPRRFSKSLYLLQYRFHQGSVDCQFFV